MWQQSLLGIRQERALVRHRAHLHASSGHIIPAIVSIWLRPATSVALSLIHRHFHIGRSTLPKLHFAFPPRSWNLLSIAVLPVTYLYTYSDIFICPQAKKTTPRIQSWPRMASTVPGLAPPPGVISDLTSPYTLQPYQTLTAVACGILTTVLVVARLYTVSTIPRHSFSYIISR